MAMARHRIKQGAGRGQWLALGGAALVVLVFTFAVGVLVGRQSSGQPEPTQAAEPARKASPLPRRSGLAAPVSEPSALGEKLTFYQTLTAPLGTVPASTRPEGIAKPQPAKPRPPSDRPAAPADRPASMLPIAAPRQDPPAAGAGLRPAQPAESRPGDWAVQVGAFRERGQAESVRRSLAASGIDAYLTAVPADDGQMRYKVRVGSFTTREDAARMAQRLRQDRSPSAFVTAR
jgi:cell division protein FtsN